jgi:ureidoglycolate hydrolase
MAKEIVAEPITASAFEAFGWLPLADTDPEDGSRRLEFEWSDPHVNIISHAPGEIRRTAGGLRCEEMYRHLTHTQALLVLDEDSVLAVAPPGTDLSSARGLDAIKAFMLRCHDSLVLHRGTWHWGPFPLGSSPVHLFNVQGQGYIKDNERADLSEFEIVVGA